jgi:hypothetical protein
VDLANNQIPLPNNFLLNPQTGLLNLPGGDDSGVDNTINAANSLDGFSTTGPIVVPFRGTVVPETVNADTLPVYNSATGQEVLVTYDVENNETGSVVTIVPVRPLDPDTTYVVVLTQGITSALSNSPILSNNDILLLQRDTPLIDGNGNSLALGVTNEQAQQLEPVRQANQAVIGAAEQLTGNSRANIPFAFAFTTQTLFQALPAAREQVVAANAGLVNTTPAPGGTAPIATQAGIPQFQIPSVAQLFGILGVPAAVPTSDIGLIYKGTVAVPQFREDPLTDYWANPAVNSGDIDVPFLLCMPDPVAFPGPRPVVIFQHGITRSKGDVFVLANAFNSQGLAIIAIDLPLHGDLKVDPSADDGEGFINPAMPRVSRDNIRQGVVGLYALTQAIYSGQTDLNGDQVPELVPGTVAAPFFLGQSLGAMTGIDFAATEPHVNRSVMNVPGGRIVNLLLNSPAFGPLVLQGLAANGISPGTPEFAQFVIFTQAVLDDVDPLNYAEPAISGSLRGGTGANLLQQLHTEDTVILPESQYDLANAFGEDADFAQIDALLPLQLVTQAVSPDPGPGLFEIPGADHGAILDPTLGPTVQIVTQAITFIGTGNIIDAGLRAKATVDRAAEDPAPYQKAIAH